MQQTPLILVIEDDVPTRQFIAEVCQEEGYQVLTAGDAIGAEPLLSHSSPDLMLCDYHLPGLCGLAFARMVRLAGSTTPIILMTADSNTVDKQDLGDVSQILYKPFTLDNLLACLATYLPVMTT
jgi:DNA-binding response OmpR family regulator